MLHVLTLALTVSLFSLSLFVCRFVLDDGEVVVLPSLGPQAKKKKAQDHDFAKAVREEKTVPRRHQRQ